MGDPVQVTVDIPKIVVENKMSTSNTNYMNREQFIAEAVLASQRNAIAYEQAMATAGRSLGQFYSNPATQIADHVEDLLNQAIEMFDNYGGA